MHPRPRPDLNARSVDGESVVLDRSGGKVHQLNATASFIWSKLDGRTSPRELAAAVVDAFDVEPETADHDVAVLLDQFRTLDLLEQDPGGGE